MTLPRQLVIMRDQTAAHRVRSAAIVAGMGLSIAALAGCGSSPPQPVMYLHEPQFVGLQLDAGRVVKGPISTITTTSLPAPERP